MGALREKNGRFSTYSVCSLVLASWENLLLKESVHYPQYLNRLRDIAHHVRSITGGNTSHDINRLGV